MKNEQAPPAELCASKPEKPAVVKITCPSPAAFRQLQPALTELLARYPGTYLSVSAGIQ